MHFKDIVYKFHCRVHRMATIAQIKDTDFDTAAHATRASSVNKFTSTSKTYVLIRAASVYRLPANGR